jgi:hypothetical protein
VSTGIHGFGDTCHSEFGFIEELRCVERGALFSRSETFLRPKREVNLLRLFPPKDAGTESERLPQNLCGRLEVVFPPQAEGKRWRRQPGGLANRVPIPATWLSPQSHGIAPEPIVLESRTEREVHRPPTSRLRSELRGFRGRYEVIGKRLIDIRDPKRQARSACRCLIAILVIEAAVSNRRERRPGKTRLGGVWFVIVIAKVSVRME